MTASVAATFPTSLSTGQALPTTDVAVTLTLSPQLVSGLRAGGATAIGATLSADLVARNGAVAQNLSLTKLRADSVSLPDNGSLLLTGTAVLPAVTPTTAGTLEVDVTDVTQGLAITGGTFTPDCATQVPPGTKLASVPVTGQTTAPIAKVAAAAAPQVVPTITPGLPPLGSGDLFLSYTLSGQTTIAKLKSSVDVSGELDTIINIGTGKVLGDLFIDPSPGTFLGFGIVPVSATTKLKETDQVTGTFVNGAVDATVDLDLFLPDSTVNGTPLSTLGNNCQTSQAIPVHIQGPLNLIGSTKFLISIDIPSFAECGTSENLDPLFDGLVSGPNNPLATTLTLVCTSGTDPANCEHNSCEGVKKCS